MLASLLARSCGRFRSKFFVAGLVLGALALAGPSVAATACPFCAAPARTLTEDLAASDIVIFAKLIHKGEVGSDAAVNAVDGRGQSKFEIVKTLKGQEHLTDQKTFFAFYFGDAEPGAMFFVTGMVLPEVKWSTPIPVTDRGQSYLSQLLSLPEKGPERLMFFWGYLEDEDSLLAQDAYDEFARASYDDVKALKDKLDRERLIDWINSPDLAQSRRRLYFTLLGVCGQPEDIVMLEDMMQSNDRRAKAGLDALIGCYLSLKGPAGMPLVEELFLKKKDAEYADTYAAIMALRVMGQESDVVPRERLLEGLHYMLDRPDLADLVIPDLARWEDWAVMDRMVRLFKEANPSSNFVRVPVVNYLEAAARQKNDVGKQAQAAIVELEKIDPEAVKRARAYAIFGPLASPKPAANSGSKESSPASSTEEKKPIDAKSGTSNSPSKGKTPTVKKDSVAPEKSSQVERPLPKVAAIDPAGEPAEPASEISPYVVHEDFTALIPLANDSASGFVETSAPNAASVPAASPVEQKAGLGQSFGTRRLGLVVGMIAIVLFGLRLVSNRMRIVSCERI